MNDEQDKPQKIANIKDLETLTKELVTLTIPFNSREIELEVRSLTPKESATLQAMLDEVRPPLVPNEDPDKEPTLNFSDPEFIRKATANQLKARALGIYIACPAFHVEGLKNEDIPEHIHKYLSDRALEKIWRVVSQDCTVFPGDEATLGARVHFTSPAS